MAKNFTVTFMVDKSPAQVFNVVTNVRGWWHGLFDEEIIGNTAELNEEFTFRAGGGVHYSKMKLIEQVPDKKVVWLVTDSELSFIEKKDEWVDTKVIFDISRKGDQTQVTFTHEGLSTDVECYDRCSAAWQMYLNQKFLPLIQSPKQELIKYNV